MGLRIGQLHAFEEDSVSSYLAQITPVPPRILRHSRASFFAAAEKPGIPLAESIPHIYTHSLAQNVQ